MLKADGLRPVPVESASERAWGQRRDACLFRSAPQVCDGAVTAFVCGSGDMSLCAGNGWASLQRDHALGVSAMEKAEWRTSGTTSAVSLRG